MQMKEINAVFDDESEHEVPEKNLIASILNLAFLDANSRALDAEGEDALEFLMSARSNKYFSMIGIDPVAARQNMIKQANRFPHFEVFRNRFRRWRKLNSKLLAMGDM